MSGQCIAVVTCDNDRNQEDASLISPETLIKGELPEPYNLIVLVTKLFLVFCGNNFRVLSGFLPLFGN